MTLYVTMLCVACFIAGMAADLFLVGPLVDWLAKQQGRRL